MDQRECAYLQECIVLGFDDTSRSFHLWPRRRRRYPLLWSAPVVECIARPFERGLNEQPLRSVGSVNDLDDECPALLTLIEDIIRNLHHQG